MQNIVLWIFAVIGFLCVIAAIIVCYIFFVSDDQKNTDQVTPEEFEDWHEKTRRRETS